MYKRLTALAFSITESPEVQDGLYVGAHVQQVESDAQSDVPGQLKVRRGQQATKEPLGGAEAHQEHLQDGGIDDGLCIRGNDSLASRRFIDRNNAVLPDA